MTTTPTPAPSHVFADDPYISDGVHVPHHPVILEDGACNDTLPAFLIPADHPNPDQVIEQVMERAFTEALAQPEPAFPWTTVGTTAAATLFVVAAAFAGYRFIAARRDASRPAHAAGTPTPTEDES